MSEAENLAIKSNALADEGAMIHLCSWVEIRNLLRADAAELRRLSAELEDARTEATALRVTEENLRAEIEAVKAQCVPDGWRVEVVSDGDIRMYGPRKLFRGMSETWLIPSVEDGFHGFLHRFFTAMLASAPPAPQAQGVPDGWLPTAKNINALPASVRRYIHDLVSNADPAGTVRDLTIAQDTIRALEASNRALRDACTTVEGCFIAAEAEGLSEALAETTDERLKDLVERRLMYSLFACQSLASAPPAPQAKPLSEEQRSKLYRAAVLRGDDIMLRSDYEQGIKDAEAAHGIKE